MTDCRLCNMVGVEWGSGEDCWCRFCNVVRVEWGVMWLGWSCVTDVEFVMWLGWSGVDYQL